MLPILPVLTPLLWIVLGTAGCAGPARGQSGGPVTIVFTHAKHPQAAQLTKLIEQFEVRHPDIRVREQILPSDSDQQHQFYVINLEGGASDFDVLDMDIIWVPEFSRAGWLTDLTHDISSKELAPLNPAALRADWFRNRLYGVPYFVDTGILYYRADLLRKYGFSPPETYPELVRMARKIIIGEHNPRLLGFVWQGKQYEGLVCTALEMIRGNGGNILGPDGVPEVTSPQTLEALQYMSNLIRRDGVTPPLVTTLDEEDSRHIFQSGRAIFMRSWPYAWPLMQQPGSPVAGRIGMEIVPHFPGHASAPTLGGFHLGVNARSRHKAAAITFVRYMIQQDVQRQILLRLGVLPADMRVLSEPGVRQQIPYLADLLPSLHQVQPRPVTPYYLMISQILQPELSAVVSGMRSPKEAMRSAQQQIEHLMGQQ